MSGAALIWIALAGPPEGEPPVAATDPPAESTSDELQVEVGGDYVIVDAAPASAFDEPRPSPVEFTAGGMTMTRVQFTRTRSVDGEGETSTLVPNRLRARLQARVGELHFLGEFQDARNYGDPIGPAHSGFHQLYVDYETGLRRGGTLTLRGGRQEYYFGSMHLFGPGPWGAGMRSYDGFRLIAGNPRGGVDLFAGSFARPLLSSPMPLVEHVAESVSLFWTLDGHVRIHDALTAGAFAHTTYQRTARETRNIQTFGLRLEGGLASGLSYWAEGHLQTGEIEVRGADSATRHAHLAGAAYASLAYMSPEGLGERGRTRLGGFLSLDFASGSRCTTTDYVGLSPCTSGRSADYYAPWMAHHRWFGHADRFDAENIIDGSIGIKSKVAAAKDLRLNMVITEHLFAFPEPAGRWHSFLGAPIGVDLDNRNHWAANEVDVEAALTYRWLRLDVAWMVVANLAGGRAVSGEALRQFVFVELTTDF